LKVNNEVSRGGRDEVTKKMFNKTKYFKYLTIWPGLAASQVFLPQQQDLFLNPKTNFNL